MAQKPVDITKLNAKLQQAATLKPTIIKQSFDYFKQITPIKSGNARNNTRLTNNKIEANYPYADVLDKGRRITNGRARGSNQAPRGMSGPTLAYMKKQIVAFLKRIGK